MPLRRVTLTGADNSVQPNDLLALSQRFPFVEWGILIGESGTGSVRYPSSHWREQLQRLQRIAKTNKDIFRLALHIEGPRLQRCLFGRLGENEIAGFERIQLNFHDACFNANWDVFTRMVNDLPSKQFIFQIDSTSGRKMFEKFWEDADLYDCSAADAVPLFDQSGGAGITPAQWPKPEWMVDDTSYTMHGYAGGLGLHNLKEQLPLIIKTAGDYCPFWIDMESSLFVNRKFDLTTCAKVLELCAHYVDPAGLL